MIGSAFDDPSISRLRPLEIPFKVIQVIKTDRLFVLEAPYYNSRRYAEAFGELPHRSLAKIPLFKEFVELVRRN